MERYEVRCKCSFDMVTSIIASSSDEAEKLAKDKLEMGYDFSFDPKLVENATMPEICEIHVDEAEEIPFA